MSVDVLSFHVEVIVMAFCEQSLSCSSGCLVTHLGGQYVRTHVDCNYCVSQHNTRL